MKIHLSLSRFMVYGMLCLHGKEAPRMANVRFIDVQARPTEFLDLTSLTLDEFQQLVLPFEAAFQAHMAAWRLDGKPPRRPPVCRLQELPFTHAGRSPVL